MKSKKIIGIDGKSKTGKTTLAKKISSEIINSEVLSLDNFRKNTNKDLTKIKLDKKSIINFISNYYNRELILKKIKESKKETIILEGCFIKSLKLNFDKYIKIKEQDNYHELIFKILKKKFTNLKDVHISAFIEFWDIIWKYYEENDIN